MADVDMTDAPPVAKKKGGDIEGKKRFEVKKVRRANACRQKLRRRKNADSEIVVERRRSVGLGHCG